MKYRMAVRPESPTRNAIAYLGCDLIFIALTILSSNLWITLLCAFLSVITGIGAITMLANVIFSRRESIKEVLADHLHASES